jgi:membrane-associated phospholipid phosphatase
MPRGIGVVEAVREAVPASGVALGALVTLAGDAATLLAVAFGTYWLAAPSADEGSILDRRRGAFVIACALGGLSLTAWFKTAFAFPRPPTAGLSPQAFAAVPFADLLRSFAESATNASGYGFPSGHAIGSTVVYGALALVADVGSRRARWSAAGVPIALVSFSRVVLGVHYPIDVLVGIAIGLTFLAALTRIGGDRGEFDATRAFAVAIGLALLATIVSEGSVPRDVVVLLGLSVGTGSTWTLVEKPRRPVSGNGRSERKEGDERDERDERNRRPGTVATGVVLVGVPGALLYSFSPSLPIAFPASAALGAVAIATPRIARTGIRAVRIARSDGSQNVSR